MKRLATIHDSTLAHRVLSALNEANVRAIETREHPPIGLYSGRQYSIIWIGEHEDVTAASRIYHDVIASQTEKQCPNCGYDLRGHAGRIECPECGRPTSATEPDRTCTGCGETVPGNFELCWNCGTAVT